MCGIVGYIGKKKAIPVLINGLLSLEYRGYDSAGVAVLNEKTNGKVDIEVIKTKGKVEKLKEKLKSIDNIEQNSNIGIAHTRWATHGKPSEKNAHPQLDNSKTFAVVHNGIIENYDELKSMLINKGYKFFSETDTEIIPNLLHYYFIELLQSEGTKRGIYNKEKKILEQINNREIEKIYSEIYLKAISKTVKTLQGSFALGIITNLFPKKLIAIKKDSPLVIGSNENGNFIASDIHALLSYTNKFYFIKDYEIADITERNITFYDFNLNKKEVKASNLEVDASSVDKNGYEDYMLKEIFEQPRAIRETIGTALTDTYKVSLPLEKINFKKFNKIYIVACGTAMHAGLVAKNLFEHYIKLPTEVDMASEFRYRNPLIDEKTLCIFISQSGETADTIAALKLSKEKKCTTIAIVNVIESSITRIADYVLYTHAGPEIAVASTKAYTCQVTLLSILGIYIYERLNEKIENANADDKLKEEVEKLKKDILKLPKKVEETLKCSEKMKEIAHKYYKNKDIFFIGREVDYAVAREGSLKLKEISYIHSEANAAGELKHGPIALIEKGVPVIGIATNDEINSKTFSNIEEVITRGADSILITNTEKAIPEIINNNQVIKIANISPMISAIISIIPMQLFAYYIAKEKGLDVDKPRNLAKSVTVE
jgi:glucosamine--fructose-6-phosphate aminotransferase (isomerizing)